MRKLHSILGVVGAPLLAVHAAEFPGTQGAVVTAAEANLFQPTPRVQMREMSTDRPDVTESPITVDAGHAQLELDVASWTRDHRRFGGEGSEQSWTFGNVNLKFGLTRSIDFQMVAPLYSRVRHGAEGFGDVTLRLKANVWGNDRGRTAFAVMPFVTLPTADEGLGTDDVEGGIIFPFSAELPRGWEFGTMVELDCLADENGSGHHLETVTSFTFGHQIAGDLSGYVELVSGLGTESAWAASFDCGLTYALTEDIQLDAGVNVGLTRAAEDLNPFLGLSIRF